MANKEYDRKPTHLEGFSLRVRRGAEASLTRGEASAYKNLTRRTVREYRAEKGAQANQKDLKPQLVDIAETHDVRGAIDERDNSVLTVVSVPSKKWNLDLLRTALGDAYQTVVHDDVSVTISLIPGLNQEAVHDALKGLLETANVSEEDREKFIKIDTTPRIDEKKLSELINDGSVILPEGALTEGNSWSITVDPLDKSLPKSKKRRVPQYFSPKQ